MRMTLVIWFLKCKESRIQQLKTKQLPITLKSTLFSGVTSHMDMETSDCSDATEVKMPLTFTTNEDATDVHCKCIALLLKCYSNSVFFYVPFLYWSTQLLLQGKRSKQQIQTKPETCTLIPGKKDSSCFVQIILLDQCARLKLASNPGHVHGLVDTLIESQLMFCTYSWISVHTFRGAGVQGELSGKLPDSKLKGLLFKSRQQETFLLRGQLSVLILISVSVPPLCQCSSM